MNCENCKNRCDCKNRVAFEKMLEWSNGDASCSGYEPEIKSASFYFELEKQRERVEQFKQKWIAEIKAEAYKEFAERLNKEFSGVGACNYGYVHHKAHYILKEMVGEDNAK